jgi:hypothetical protein
MKLAAVHVVVFLLTHMKLLSKQGTKIGFSGNEEPKNVPDIAPANLEDSLSLDSEGEAK